ncbi:MAG: hypothetical protein INH41_11425 [Myxococcaceae bacterium]|jgi:hypothetical protein|nr:hypothetical protein [Myxococcaceae bacterium]MCA3012992.1 hypothetical protein [Myxococcaceae bacterium]
MSRLAAVLVVAAAAREASAQARAGAAAALVDGYAQVVRPMGEALSDPGAASAPERPEASPSARELGSRPGRASWLSAGRGGPVFALTELVAGGVAGALVGTGVAGSGSPFTAPQGGDLGALLGGVTVGALGLVVQYFQPMGLLAACAAALGAGVGALAGLGAAVMLAERVFGLPAVLPGLLALAGSQVGALVPLSLLWTAAELSPGDLALVGAGALSALALTGLVSVAWTTSLAPGPALVAPALGAAVGGLLAAATELPAGAVLRFTGVPLGVAVACYVVAAALSADVRVAAITALTGAGIAVGVTALVTAATEPRSRRAEVEVTPTMSLLPPPPGAAPWAAGPALAGRF